MQYNTLGLNTGYNIKTVSETGKTAYAKIQQEYNENKIGRASRIATYNTEEDFQIKERANSLGETRQVDYGIKYDINYDNYGKIN